MTRARFADGERLRWWAALPVAAVGGYLLDIASPDVCWWPASLLGTLLILAAVWQQRAGLGALAGAVAGAAFWMPHISWLTLYLGPVPWLGLCGVMVLWFALFGLAGGVATRGLCRWAAGREDPRPALLVIAQALTAAGLWVLREQVQGTWPYGGYAWGRLAHMQSYSPLAESVSWLGFAGLSGAVAFACALVVAAGFRGIAPTAVPRADAAPASAAAPRSAPLLLGALGGALALLILLGLVPPAGLERTGAIRVAAVQGNSKSGIFDDRESGDVLRAHLDATEDLLDRLEADGESVDVIVWPENSAEYDLPDNPLAELRIAQLSKRAGAPIVVGTILPNDDGSYRNSTLVWGPDGLVPGVRYDKLHPVPFAEYMPNRDFFHALAPDLVDLVQLEYAPGTRSPVAEVRTADGPVRAGLAICFDIIFDAQARGIVGDGAQVILAQTNNADFGRTDESVQQLAIARLRAIETGRAVVNISTVGTSAIELPDGRETHRLPTHTAGAMVSEVPLVAGETPALRFGAWIAGGWMVVGGAGLALGAVASIRARRAARRSTRP